MENMTQPEAGSMEGILTTQKRKLPEPQNPRPSVSSVETTKQKRIKIKGIPEGFCHAFEMDIDPKRLRVDLDDMFLSQQVKKICLRCRLQKRKARKYSFSKTEFYSDIFMLVFWSLPMQALPRVDEQIPKSAN